MARDITERVQTHDRWVAVAMAHVGLIRSGVVVVIGLQPILALESIRKHRGVSLDDLGLDKESFAALKKKAKLDLATLYLSRLRSQTGDMLRAHNVGLIRSLLKEAESRPKAIGTTEEKLKSLGQAAA